MCVTWDSEGNHLHTCGSAATLVRSFIRGSSSSDVHCVYFQECIISQEQLLRELDMYQEIAVAKGAAYESLNIKMDRCQQNIEVLSDEIQRLQGMSCL